MAQNAYRYRGPAGPHLLGEPVEPYERYRREHADDRAAALLTRTAPDRVQPKASASVAKLNRIASPVTKAACPPKRDAAEVARRTAVLSSEVAEGRERRALQLLNTTSHSAEEILAALPSFDAADPAQARSRQAAVEARWEGVHAEVRERRGNAAN